MVILRKIIEYPMTPGLDVQAGPHRLMNGRRNTFFKLFRRVFIGSLLCVLSFFILPVDVIQGARSQPTPENDLFLPVVANGVPPASSWLSFINYYRDDSGLLPLAENPPWSEDAWYHARYMVKNDVIAHTEDPGNLWYTPQGQTAAVTSNLMVSTNSATTDEQALQMWLKAPFHAVSLLDPELLQTGFGSFREVDPDTGGIEMGAAIDVLRGISLLPPTVTFPIFWPGPDSPVPLARYEGEIPDPLTSCPGYEMPTGLPAIVQLGNGSGTPQVTGHSFKRGSTLLEHCIFDESTYSNPDGNEQALGRSILDERDAVVIVPRQPLQVGETYTVTLSTTAGTYTWSFTVTGDE